jgi:uncharacterized protein with gpF-like domain
MRLGSLDVIQAMQRGAITQAEALNRVDNLMSTIVSTANVESNAANFVGKVDSATKRRFEESAKKTLGVDFFSVLQTENMQAQFELAIAENADLIKDITIEQANRTKRAVLDNARGVKFEGGLTGEIQRISGVTKRRASFIARDQTSKMTSNRSELLQKSAGVKKYIWQTAEDNRVVGTPGGLYPEGSKGHGDHYERNGKEFSWDDPPSDGHPGEAFNCRCIAKPIFDRSELDAI